MSAVHRLPPRPTPRAAVPRPESCANLRAPRRSEPRLSLHSIDLEADDEKPRDSQATLSAETEELDPIDVVIDALRTVTCETAVEAASLCLAWCARALRARAALVYLYDAEARELVVVYALGERAGHILLTRHKATEATLAKALHKRSPRVENYGDERRPPARYAFIGGAWSALVAPVLDGTRILGAIELVDPLDGSCFDEGAIAAACYTTKRLAELLAAFDGTIGAVIRPPED